MACFFCRNSINSRPNPDGVGWIHDCKLGLDNPHPPAAGARKFEDVLQCPGASPRWGFQIGGYYTHMWLEQDGDCLTWYIEGDGMFPTPGKTMNFHICDFKQIERFVRLWGQELRKRGWVDDDEGEV